MTNQDWQHIIDGDPEAYEKLYVDYFKKFYNYGRKFTDDITIVEDSIQDTFLAIWIKKIQIKDINFPTSYLFSSFRYILFKKIKQSNRLLQHPDEEQEPDFTVEHIIIIKETDQELQLKLHTALKALTSRQREAIFLRFYEGLSYEEIAVVLDISVKATYKIIARSLLSLKNKFSFTTAIIAVLSRLSGYSFSTFFIFF